MPKKIKSHKIIVCDVDDTLILWNKSAYPTLPKLEVEYAGYKSTLCVHRTNVNLLIKLAKLGYTIIVWSVTGYDWAEAIVKALSLEPYVSLCLTKPKFYIDDKEAKEWIGERLWREPK